MVSLDLGLEDGCKAFLGTLQSPISVNIRKLVDIESVEDSIGTIQEKINSLVACQQALRGVRNTLVPISRLPREVLSHIIFDLVVHSPPSRPYEIRFRPYLVLTRVCRDWRRLAIENQALWTRPDFSRAALANMMLERAGKMPLIMDVTYGHVDIIRQHADKLPRIKELSLDVNGAEFLQALAGLKPSMPRLETLTIKGNMYRPSPLQGEFLEIVEKSPLKRLALTGCRIPWSSDCLAGLVSLSIVLDYSSSDYFMVYSDFLQMLQRNPNLVDLRLALIMSSAEKLLDVPSQSECVVLPCLESLRIEGSMHDSVLARVLVSIQAPRLSHIELPEITTDTDSDYANLVNCTSRFARNINPAIEVRSATITPIASVVASGVDPNVSLQITLACARPGSQTTFALRLAFRSEQALRGSDVQNVVAAVLDDLPMDMLKELTIKNVGSRASDQVKLDAVWKAASLLPRLETLCVTHQACLGVDSNLLEYYTSIDAPKSLIYFPAIKSFSWTGTWSEPFKKTYWKKTLVTFVEATRHRVMLPGATSTEFKLCQDWCPKGRALKRQAKVCVRGAEVSGNFVAINDADNAMDSVLKLQKQKQKQTQKK